MSADLVIEFLACSLCLMARQHCNLHTPQTCFFVHHSLYNCDMLYQQSALKALLRRFYHTGRWPACLDILLLYMRPAFLQGFASKKDRTRNSRYSADLMSGYHVARGFSTPNQLPNAAN